MVVQWCGDRRAEVRFNRSKKPFGGAGDEAAGGAVEGEAEGPDGLAGREVGLG